MLGEAVSRGPMRSSSSLAVAITCEWRKASWRMRVSMSRSTFSWAKTGKDRAAASRNGVTLRMDWDLPCKGLKKQQCSGCEIKASNKAVLGDHWDKMQRVATPL